MSAAGIQRARAVIDREYARRLTVEDLARRAGLSTFHFIRAFKAGTGQTPHQYLRAQRIARAKHLLETTPLPVTEICEQVGTQLPTTQLPTSQGVNSQRMHFESLVVA